MANVWEAMKRHEAEQSARAPAPDDQDAPQADAPVVDTPDDQPSPAAAKRPAPPDAQRRSRGSAPADAQRPARGPAQTASPRTGPAGLAARNGKVADELVASHDPGGQLAEEYRTLRTSLLSQDPDGQICLMITSSDPGEGKTITTANLGIVLAEMVDRQTVLVDCDLRKGRLTALLGSQEAPGMINVLNGEMTVDACIQRTILPRLSLVGSGAAPAANAGEMIGRPAMEESIHQLRQEFDCVLIDTPPMDRASDAGTIGRAVGQALLVVRMNKTRKESVSRAIRLLHAANAEPAGVILTHRQFQIPRYVYRYT